MLPTSVDFGSATSAVALGVGLLLALVCYLFTNISPGGLIVPGWLALTLVEGWRTLVFTGGAMLVTFGVSKLLGRIVVLYGKRLFAVTVMIGVAIEVGAFIALNGPFPEFFPHETLGLVVPGLVAYQLLRQRALPTLVATSVTTLVCSVILFVVVAL